MTKAADVPWTDNQGEQGYVLKNQYHSQSYYPLWLDEAQMTFTGTLLSKNAIDESGKGTYWVQYAFPWGYVDNHPNNDVRSNFKLDWAVDAAGNHVDLDEIHFVKVFTGQNQDCGWLGETSTELDAAYDWNMLGSYDTVTICGDVYSWQGKNYNRSGDYYTMLTSKAQLDSSAMLHLTLKPIHNTDYFVTACRRFQWEGTEYTESGAYTKTLTSSCGCDSIITLNLTIVDSYEQTVNAVSCDGSYVWHTPKGDTIITESGTFTKKFASVGGCDSVVTLNLRMSTPSTNHVQVTTCGDSYTWGGQTYTKSGQYTRTFASAMGCDSVVTLHLNLVERYENTVEVLECGGEYTWEGDTYTVGGDYTKTFTSILGCDSIVTLKLVLGSPIKGQSNVTAWEYYVWEGDTIYQKDYKAPIPKVFQSHSGCDSTHTLSIKWNNKAPAITCATACGSFIWEGTEYTESGTYDNTTSTPKTRLVLTIKTPVTHEFTATACGAYWWNGIVYAASGDYQQVFRARNGCDSTVTMHLTIDQPTLIEKDITVCGSYVHGGVMYMQSGLQTAVYGCDSTVRLNITVNPIHNVAFGQMACGSYEWEGETYTISGVYTKTLTSSLGCDSIVTMDLQLLQPRIYTLYDTVCGGITWQNEHYAVSGTYSHTIAGGASNGCDSTVMLQLTVRPEHAIQLTDTVLRGAGYSRHGFNLTEAKTQKSGVHSLYLKSEHGCDSTVLLHLTVLDATDVPAVLAEQVRLHPNPSSGTLMVSGTAPFSRAEVYSTTGHLVHSCPAGYNQLTLNLHHLPAGVYTLRLCGQQGCITRRFVKM